MIIILPYALTFFGTFFPTPQTMFLRILESFFPAPQTMFLEEKCFSRAHFFGTKKKSVAQNNHFASQNIVWGAGKKDVRVRRKHCLGGGEKSFKKSERIR